MNSPVRKKVHREQGDVSYLEWDSARPGVHFAHATGFNAETYKSLLSPLASRFQIFASDMRGHGFSTLPARVGENSWTVYASDLHEFLGAVHPGPLILAGHSMGSIASLMVAARHPEHVRALVLAEPVLVPQMAGAVRRLARFTGLRRPVPDMAERAARRREIFASFDEVFHAYRGRGAFKSWSDQVLRDYLTGGLVSTGNGTEMRLACSPAWEAASFRATPLGVARLAGRVRCPLTVLVGENGTAHDRELSTLMRIHGSTRLVRVPGTTHFLPMERPEIVREEIERIAHQEAV